MVSAKVHKSMDLLRKETCEEFDTIFKRLNIKKRMSLAKADVIISLRMKKLREFEARNYELKKR